MSSSGPIDGAHISADGGTRVALYRRWFRFWCCALAVMLGQAAALVLTWQHGLAWPYRFSPVWARGWAPGAVFALATGLVQFLGLAQALALRPAYPRMALPG